MEKEIISNKQGVALISMFVLGNALIITPKGSAGKDIWLSILFALVLIIPMLFVYSRLINIYPGNDLFDLQKLLFGKAVGSITIFIFVMFSFHLGAMVLRDFSEFIQIVSFPQTPQFVTLILIGTLCIIGTKCGIEVIARWSSFTFPLIILTLGTLFVFSLPNTQATNIKPIFYNGLIPVIKNGIPIFMFPFAEVALFTMVLNSLKTKDKTFRVFLYGILIAGIILTLAMLRNISVLGAESMFSYYFPLYNAASVIDIANFFDRFEIFIAAIFVVGGFLKATICLYTACKGISKVFNVENYSEFAAPVGILMATVATFVFENIAELYEWSDVVYKYYAFPFLILLPIIIWIFAEVKSRKSKRERKA